MTAAVIGLQGEVQWGSYDKSEGEGRVRCATKFVVTVLVRQGTFVNYLIQRR
jgi:hypothetical protein